MNISEKVGIKGRARVILRRTSKHIQILEELQKKEWETGKILLRDPDRKILEGAIENEVTVDNLTMTRCIDYMVSLFGRACGFGLNTIYSDDRNNISNFYESTVTLGGITERQWSAQTTALFPEILGIGYGITPPTITDPSLDSDFNEARNTYNSKFGGYVKPGITFKDDYISQYAYIYSPDEINDLQFPIFEIGLYAPEIHVGKYPIQTPSGNVLFSATGNTPNRFWNVLNVSTIEDLGGGTVSITTKHRANDSNSPGLHTFHTTRSLSEQILTIQVYNGLTNNDRAIVAYTPYYNSVAAVLGEWGYERAFTLGPLLARVVLPFGFIKNQNYSLTILWQIYFNRM